MTIHIPRSVLVAASLLFCAGIAGLLIKQLPELTRYAKIEGM